MSWAQLTDARVYYEVRGAGPPLLLVPGLGSTSRVWEPVLPKLAERFSVIAMDNRGVGRSTPIRPARSLSDYCADLLELLDHLQIDRAHVLGLSLGGIVAQRFAVDHPSRIDRLVLVSCTHRFEPYLREMVKLLGVTLNGAPGAAGDLFTRTVELLGSGPVHFDADPQRVGRALRAAEQAGVPRRDVLRQLQCLLASEPQTEMDESRVRCPTLVLAGEYDAIIPPYYGRRMANEIPGSRFLLVPDAGHNPLADCPDKVRPMIERFLKEREPANDSAAA